MNIKPRLISVVVPVYNEAETLSELHERLLVVLETTGVPFELIFVNDGSRDGSTTALRALSPARVLNLKRNYGQTVALAAGIRAARGEVIVTLDADLENHPEDIPLLLAKLDEGYDVVTGWRERRWRGSPARRIFSRAANALLSRLAGMRLHDAGCTLRAYRADVLHTVSFSGDMHRLLLAYLVMRGAAIAQIRVQFTPRRHGKSHYGVSRVFGTVMDMIAFTFFERYHNKPLHFFGAAGAGMMALSVLTFAIMVVLRLSGGPTFIETPLPVLAVFFALVAFQAVLIGLVAEFLYRFSRKELPTSSEHYIKNEEERI
ncbi:MAG: glycosyltransferase family 2 protein [Patescibacteria group bacterium]